MTNKERDEILLALVKGVNSLQVTVNDMRADMKNFVTKEEFESKIGNLATKEEISKLATKEEISKLATKEEISKLATKEEISKLATKEEISKLATKEEISKLATKEEISKLVTKEEISKLATKEELKELKDEMIRKIDESKNEIRAEVVEAIKEASHISYDRYIELKNRIAINEKDIKEIKLAIAN